MVVITGDEFLNSNAFLFFILLILLLQLRERKVSMGRLLIMPLIMVFASMPFFYMASSMGWFQLALVILGLVVGLILGVYLGSLMEVKLREEDGKVVMKGSIVLVIVWAVIIIAKITGKGYLSGAHILSLDVLSAIFLAITLGTMISRRVVIYRRYLEKKKLHSLQQELN